MKYLLALAATVALQASAESIIDPATSLRLGLNNNSNPRLSRGDTDYVDDPESPYVPLMIQIDSDDAIASLQALGVTIYRQRGDILLTGVPREALPMIENAEGVSYIASSGILSRCLDMARPFGHVDAVQTGDAPLAHGYDGTGIVVGFSDTGFYPGHIAFEGRIRALYDYNIPAGEVREAVTPDQIATWTTDNDDETHATHVANILAGAYLDNGYYGVATGADIVATTSRLSDVGILCGVEDIISYAKAHDKPCVINLSLSNFLGPHDGTDLFCRYLSACADDAIICISAGNYGQREIFATGVLTESTPDIRVKVGEKVHWVNFDIDGYMDVWSEDATPFRYRIMVYDGNTETPVYEGEWIGGTPSPTKYTLDSDEVPAFAEYFSGKIITEAAICPLNGRYEAVLHCTTKTEAVADAGPWARYRIVLDLCRCDGAPDRRVNIFSDGAHINLGNVPGHAKCVSYAGSISDLCTADGVISIGMAESRITAPALSGGEYEWSGTPGTICPHSSYADTPGIKRLPHFSAPGYWVVSAMSTPYLEKHPDVKVCAEAIVDDTKYYWYPECGTSMSSPFSAGVIATWLQANPDLKSADIIDIARSTAMTDYTDIADPRWGAGCIDAMAGLRKVITDSSTSSIEVIDPLVTVGADGSLQITFAGGKVLPYTIFTLSGVALPQTSALRPGIYILAIRGHSPRKIIIR